MKFMNLFDFKNSTQSPIHFHGWHSSQHSENSFYRKEKPLIIINNKKSILQEIEVQVFLIS